MDTNGNRDGPATRKRPRQIFDPTATSYQSEADPQAAHLYNSRDNSAAQWTDLRAIEEARGGPQDTAGAHDPANAREPLPRNRRYSNKPVYRKWRLREHRRTPSATVQTGPGSKETVAKPTQRPMVEPRDTLLGMQEVVQRVGMNRSSIYVQMRLGTFPLPIKISIKSVRWIASEIEAWVQSRPRATEEVGNWRLKKRL